MSVAGMMIVGTTALTGGMLIAALLWMWCHRTMYKWRDFGIVGLMLTAILYRYSVGIPPDSHVVGIVTMNFIYVWMVIFLLPRPRHIPMIERRRNCGLNRLFSSASDRKASEG